MTVVGGSRNANDVYNQCFVWYKIDISPSIDICLQKPAIVPWKIVHSLITEYRHFKTIEMNL